MGQFLNNDRNLLNLDILAVADTRLIKENSTHDLKIRLSNWRVLSRFDADDGNKHMGLLLLQSRTSLHQDMCSKENVFVKRYIKETLGKDEIFAQTMTLKCSNFAVTFIYINRTPTFNEVERINQTTQHSNIIMGDLNLDPSRDDEDQRLL